MPRGSQQAGPVAGADARLLVPRLLCPSRPLVCCQEPVTERRRPPGGVATCVLEFEFARGGGRSAPLPSGFFIRHF